jgi:hypothetical protein
MNDVTQVALPITVACDFIPNSILQVFAHGEAYTTNNNYNTNIGAAQTMLMSTYGSNVLVGELNFNFNIPIQPQAVYFVVNVFEVFNGSYNTVLTISMNVMLVPGTVYYYFTPNPFYYNYPYYYGYYYHYYHRRA